MSYPCFVCERKFGRSQDRASHIRLKQDDAHRQHVEAQSRKLTTSFVNAVEITTGATTTISLNDPPPSVQCTNVDSGDIPSSTAMIIDTRDNDDEDDSASIASSPAEVVDDHEDGMNDKFWNEVMKDVSNGAELDEAFNFLPDPDLDDVAQGDPGTGPTPERRRTLVDDNVEERTWRWNDDAGWVYGHKHPVHGRWSSLFSSTSAENDYQPFNSRLDWEIAQWAVREKISQTSFDRLLNIPQVLFPLLVTT